LCLLSLLIFRVFYVAYRANGQFPTLLCTGIGSMLLYQTYVNIFMCLGIGPVMGLPLPFFSYGGSSMLTNFLAIGIVAGISMRTKQNKQLRLVEEPVEEEAAAWDTSKNSVNFRSSSLKKLHQKIEIERNKLPKIKRFSLPHRSESPSQKPSSKADSAEQTERLEENEKNSE
jgi:hypothetical protein